LSPAAHNCSFPVPLLPHFSIVSLQSILQIKWNFETSSRLYFTTVSIYFRWCIRGIVYFLLEQHLPKLLIPNEDEIYTIFRRNRQVIALKRQDDVNKLILRCWYSIYPPVKMVSL
jgi:hypothetical protein